MISILLLVTVQLTCFAETLTPKPFDSFLFGIATAPGQTEDQLNDTWKAWGDSGKISGYHEEFRPEERLQTWTHPDGDLDLIAGTGAQVYRMGIDWGRIMPAPHQFDPQSLVQYHGLITKIKSRKLKIMMTLMHHSIPVWAQNEGGWLKDGMKDHFLEFSKKMMNEFHSDVDYWVSFNEGNIFALLSYTAGLWPPGEKRPISSLLYFGPFKGDTLKAMDRMADAHNVLYEWSHQQFQGIRLGLAHNMAFYTGKTWFNRWKSKFTDELMNWRFPERVRGHMDFFGFNYYGAEWLAGDQIAIDPEEEYSEAGRAVYPEGLHWLLKEIHRRFDLPILITENGIADSTDFLRPAYLIEHLKAVETAIKEGIPVKGYFVWTLSDNLEWSDGYCPKFGLVSVDRKDNFKRSPRYSYEVFKKIIREKEISTELRESSWQRVVDHQGASRPFCRAADGITSLGKPTSRAIVKKDWRFR